MTPTVTEDQRRAIEQDCIGLMHRYAVNADHRVEQFTDVFADDAVWVRPGQEMHGRDQIGAFMGQRHDPKRRDTGVDYLTRHVITTSEVAVLDADHAQGTFYALVFRDDEWSGDLPVEMNTIQLLVEYHTSFVRTAEGWRISRHEAHHVFRR